MHIPILLYNSDAIMSSDRVSVVLQQLTDGLENKQIAHKLMLSCALEMHTVQQHTQTHATTNHAQCIQCIHVF